MHLKIDYNNMMQEFVGEENGISISQLNHYTDTVNLAYQRVMEERGKNWQEWTNLPFVEQDILKNILKTSEKYKNYDSAVVLGIGGSALGAAAVFSALSHFRHNELKKEKRQAPRLYIEDNIDPDRMQALLDVIDIKNTVFIAITKSGTTSETLSQFLILEKILKETLPNSYKDNIIVITTLGKGTLDEIAVKEGYQRFGIGQGVGGRFSVFSAVGLLPLAIAGIDIKGLLEGARTMSDACYEEDIYRNPALLTALLEYISVKKGKSITVMMPYSDKLKLTADFYCQLWGESLAKAIDNDNKISRAGQTPVKALGVTDQHSQIQLYTEGAFDKVITFIKTEKFENEIVIPKKDNENTDFLGGKTLNQLINYELEATKYALIKTNRPNFTIILPEINPYTIGELLQYFMYTTAFMGAMLNIDTYSQPGVEEGKQATFAMLGRKGYENKLKEINQKKPMDIYILKN